MKDIHKRDSLSLCNGVFSGLVTHDNGIANDNESFQIFESPFSTNTSKNTSHGL